MARKKLKLFHVPDPEAIPVTEVSISDAGSQSITFSSVTIPLQNSVPPVLTTDAPVASTSTNSDNTEAPPKTAKKVSLPKVVSSLPSDNHSLHDLRLNAQLLTCYADVPK